MEQETRQLQEGPQRQAGESTATVIIYGGGAGSGKTYWLAHENAKYWDDSAYGSVIFRRTKPELKGIGSIWDECLSLYPLLGGDLVESRLECTFPSGARVKLDGLEHEKDKLKYQGKSLGGIAFDELTHFTEGQFWFLFSRLRGWLGAKCRATCNPDPDSWVRQLVDWYIGEDGYPIADRSGVVRWFARKGEDLLWFDTEEEGISQGLKPISLTFISAKIWDNRILLAKDPDYLAKLEALPPVERARLLGGNWNVRLSAGDYFQEAWFPVRDAGALAHRLAGHPRDEDIIRKFRCWDCAGTPHKGDTVPGSRTKALAEGDPDWTVGLLLGETRTGLLIILDCVYCRDTPGEVERLIIETAIKDGPTVKVLEWQDPGQAGVYQVAGRRKAIAAGCGFGAKYEAIVARENKEEYAKLPSRTTNKGRILLQRGPWNRWLLNQLTAFPNKKVHDDAVDALSLGCTWIFDNPRSAQGLPKQVDEVARHVSNDVRTTSRIRSL